MDKDTMKDIQRSIAMKLNKVDYTEVKLVNGYEDTESVYKGFRDKLKEIIESISWLKTYEYGGSTMKSVYSKVNLISSTSKIGNFSNHDIYETNGMVGLELSKIGVSSGLSDIGMKYYQAYAEISRLKDEMNKKLEEQINKISKLRDKSNMIDKSRKKIINLRYDLEMERRSKSNKTPESTKKESDMEQELENSALKTLNEMELFVGNKGISGVLQKVAEAHLEFCEKSAKALKECTR